MEKKSVNGQEPTANLSLSVAEVFSCTLPHCESLRIGVMAGSGAGKTTLLRTASKWAAFSERARVIIYDPMDEYYGNMVHNIKDFIRSAADRASITRFEDDEMIDDVLNIIGKLGNCLLIIDEAYQMFPARKNLNPYVKAILRRGRHQNIGIIWSTLRPTMCHSELPGVSSGVVVGRFVSITDCSYVRTNYGIGILPNYNWVALLPDGTKCNLKLTGKEVRQNG